MCSSCDETTASSPRRPARRSLFAAAIALSQTVLLPLPASLADGTKRDKQRERSNIDRRLEEISSSLEGVESDLVQTYLDLAETEMLIPQAQKDLDAARAEEAAAKKAYDEVARRLTAAQTEEQKLSAIVESGQKELDRSDQELSQIALEAYKGGSAPNPATVYFGSASPQDTVDKAMNYRLTLASQGKRLDSLRTSQAVNVNAEDRLIAVRKEIEGLKAEAEQTLKRKETATAAAQKAKTDLDALYAKQQTQREALEAKKRQYEGQQKSLENRQRELDEELRRLAIDEKKKEKRRRKEKPKGSEAPIDTGGGGWRRPTYGRISSPFGWRVHPIYRTRKLHGGIDFAVPCGTPVGSTRSGRIIANTYNRAAGKKVIVSHGIINGKLMTSSYHHLRGYAKPVGALVRPGDTVGYVGTTGSSTGCHLHFEIHEDGRKVNPRKYV